MDVDVRLLVLDFDGVVIESNDAKTEAFSQVFARFPEHHDAMMAYHHANVSASRFQKFDHLLSERLQRAGDTTLRDDLAADFSRRTLDRLEQVPFVRGAREFLAEMSPRVPLYLASVTPQTDLDDLLRRRGIAAYFRYAYGCPPWNKAEAVRDAMRRENVPAAQTVLVGDSAGDRVAAASAGVRFVARDSGLPFDPPADPIFPDLAAIADFLRPMLP
jgi:phosphoglycolate phosphatase-like HAD superfamily hydrolase